jgi:voltage-gated potassium channel Kch
MGTLRAALTYLMTSRLRDWLVLVPVAAAALTLAMIGYTLHCKPGHCLGFAAALFRSIDLLRFGRMPDPSQSPLELFIVPFLIPGAMLVTGARLALRNLMREMRVVWAHRLRDHAIVCGLGDTGLHVIENLRAAGTPVVVITLNLEDEKAAACEELGIPVLKGDARQLSLLNLAGLPYARLLIATCGSDAVNVEIGLRARDALTEGKAQRGSFQVLPEMRSQWLLETIWLHRSAALGSESIEFRPFNLYSGAVLEVLRRAGFGRLAREPEGSRPRVLLAGFGETNTQLILQAVQNTFALPRRRFRATVFDDKGGARLPALEARYPGVMSLADIDFVGCTFATEDPSAWSVVDEALGAAVQDASALSAVVALADDATSLYAALQFRERLDRHGAVGAPVFVRLRDQSRLGGFMASLDGPDILVTRFAPFGDLGALTKPRALFDSRADALARALHESYLEITADAGDYPAAVPWAQLPERFKQSNRLFADHLPIALNELGIVLAEVDAPPLALTEGEIEALAAMEHWRWSIERQLLGWTAGKPRDDAARRHPLLLPWPDLEEEDRERNRRLARAIPKIAAAAGVGLLRERFIALCGRSRADIAAEVAALEANEQGVLLLDPQDAAGWAAARDALAERAVKIWIVWRVGAPIPAFPKELSGKEVLRPAIAGWIGERESAALFAGERRAANGAAAPAREAAA